MVRGLDVWESIADSRPLLKAEHQAGSQRHPTDVKSRQRSLRWGAPYPTYGEQSVFYGSYLDLFTLGCSGNHGYCRHGIMTQTPQANYSSSDRRYLPWPI